MRRSEQGDGAIDVDHWDTVVHPDDDTEATPADGTTPPQGQRVHSAPDNRSEDARRARSPLPRRAGTAPTTIETESPRG